MSKYLLVVVPVLLSPAAIAQDASRYQCSLDEITRRVEIFSEPGVTVPCEVHYYKDTEMPGERQVLWRAMNEEGFCEARVTEFIEKLRDMGWTCWDAGAPAAQSESADADDTEALAPAEEIEIPASDPPH